MQYRVKLFRTVCCVLFLLLLCACRYPGSAPAVGRTLKLEDRVYGEVTEETQKALALEVDSISGLAAVGEAMDADNQAPRTAYAYPDPRYPNLLVVSIDGKPTLFQFENFTQGYRAEITELLDIYGMTEENTIRKIRVSRQNGAEKAAFLSEITEEAAFRSFFDCVKTTHATLNHDASGEFPVYFLDVELSNGFTVPFAYHPGYQRLSCGGVDYSCNTEMSSWFDLYIPE